MKKNAIGILKSEHRSISAVISGLKELARMAHEAVERPDFTVFRAMLRYIDEYTRFHWSHMRKEEDKLLPLAELHLNEADWQAIGEAFAGNQDPIADLREKDFEMLFSRIASLAPAPVGLDEPWKKLG